jgi:hypothetical protein
MKRASHSRMTAELSNSLHQRLNAYAIVASAAGVGLLALVLPAEGKIVYTKAHKVIGPNSFFQLDLNHDGISDFVFANETGQTDGYASGYFRVGGSVSDNSIVTTHRGDAAALRAGVRVGGKPLPPHFFGPIMAAFREHCTRQCTTHFSGPWANSGKGVKNRYLGLKFLIKGKTHYGWARLNCGPNNIDGVLTGYAYETIPDKPIITGKTKGPDVTTVQPASLGHLAAGASALSAWRVKQTAATTY